MFGYKKETRKWHQDPNWDYYSHYSKGWNQRYEDATRYNDRYR